VIGRRPLPLGLAVAALLILAGIASHGRPLSGGGGPGPTATFFDYLATTLLIFSIAMLAVVIWSLFSDRTNTWRAPQRRSSLVGTLLTLAGSVLLAYLISQTSFVQRLQNLQTGLGNQQQARQANARTEPQNARNPRLRWDEIGIVVALLAGTAVVLLATRQARRTPRRRALGREESLSLALDESIDDLRRDPDLRRAIIAAYARTEVALARAGLPRRSSEAPFEYLERALGSLDTSADAARRLTGLFEWAKFSSHEPEPEMRDEAIDALVAVRDELREPRGQEVTA
jgi:Domain of unknown function (DUF4129)